MRLINTPYGMHAAPPVVPQSSLEATEGPALPSCAAAAEQPRRSKRRPCHLDDYQTEALCVPLLPQMPHMHAMCPMASSTEGKGFQHCTHVVQHALWGVMVQ